ncbi:alpha/beta hydrolase [Polaribacter sp. WD7]|uniref:alpha/beta hydrolase n=1 Tax=Polaribacter sp. WD7 TaxID=2269061 RepID=UPI000DF1D9C2|nr:alpha/beta hydrolase [Polaribacter sp. WD7]RCS28279.1 alpha/beta hydrolase [Polaribacter sp. WD7]
MNRLILYIIIHVIGVATAIAQIKTEEIVIYNNNIELPGTLSFTKENTPLIIWIHGSGNVDRNGNQQPFIKANYIKQFRDSVNKYGVSFYSFDKRTANKKNIKSLKKGVLFKDYIADVQETILHFKKDTRFAKIVLIGHSQGSLIAMLNHTNAGKIVSLAGPSMSADKTIITQIQEKAPYLDSITKAHFKELANTGSIQNVNLMLQSIFRKENQSFLSSWIKYNPSKEIQKIAIPVLIVNGDNDLQVKVSDAQKLHASNKNSELLIIPKMNHVLKVVNSVTENQNSYTKPDFPLSSNLIQHIVKFVNQ